MNDLKIPVTKDDHIQGNPKALITLVAYGDYECPACGHAYPIVKRLQKHFGTRLNYVFRNFPLNEIHPHAMLAAETAEFAASYKLFWEMHDLLFENQDHLNKGVLLKLADVLHLPVLELEDAFAIRTYDAKIRSDFLGGVKSGVHATPTFYVNGQRLDGHFEFEDLMNAIEQVKV